MISDRSDRRCPMSLAVSLTAAAVLSVLGCIASSTPTRQETPVALDLPVSAYVEASRTAARTTVVGKVSQGARKPDAPDEPLTGTVVMLLPYSDAVRARLDAIKQGARASADKFVTAAVDMRKARAAFEAALWERGAADLVLTTTVEADGTFRLEGVPAGRWLLYATHARFRTKEGASRIGRDGRFPQERRFEGFYNVTVWLRELRIEATPPEVIELTDRNVWFTGVAEEWSFRPRPPIGSGPR